MAAQPQPLNRAFVYDAADNNPEFIVHREDVPGQKKKKIRQSGPSGSGPLPERLKQDGSRPLFHLPQLLAQADEPCLLPEGEPHVDTLRSLGFVATTTSQGAGKARYTDLGPLVDRPGLVVLMPDRDVPGFRHMADIYHRLREAGRTDEQIRWLDLPVDEKGDVLDWLAAGGTPEQLRQLITGAPTAAERLRTSEGSDNPVAPHEWSLNPITHVRVAWEWTKVSRDGWAISRVLDKGTPAERHVWDVQAHELADAIIADFHLKWCNGEVVGFNGRHYQPVTKTLPGFILQVLRAAPATKISKELQAEVLHQIHDLVAATEDESDIRSPWNHEPWLVFENGQYNVETGAFRGHSAAVHNTFMVHAKYDPTAEATVVDQFCDAVFPEPEARAMVEELLGLLLCAFDPTHARWIVFLLGSGANGKSVLVSVIHALLAGHVATTGLGPLGQTFGMADLVGKVANVVADEAGQYLRNTAFLKQISGGDRVRAERKYRDAFVFAPNATLVFSLNDLPLFGDKSYGIQRRLVILPFLRQFRGPDADPTMADMVTKPAALARWTQLALAGYRRYVAQGRRFTTPASAQKALAEYVAELDLIQDAADQGIIQFGAKLRVGKRVLFEVLKVFAEQTGRRPYGEKEIKKRLLAIFPDLQDGQRLPVDQGRSTCWVGVELGPYGEKLRKGQLHWDGATLRFGSIPARTIGAALDPLDMEDSADAEDLF